MKKITLCWLLVFTGIISSVQAQYVYDYKHTADVYYNARDYYSAAQYYNKALGTFKVKPEQVLPYTIGGPPPSGKMKDYQQVVARLAESYRLYNDYGNAETWYAQLVGFNNPQFPQARYWYGVCLRANGKYQEALEQFNKFKQSYTAADDISTRATLEIQTCEFAIEEDKKQPRFSIIKTSGTVNEGGANYAPVMLDANTLMFTSSRPENMPAPAANTSEAKKNREAKKAGTPYVNTLYTATGSGNDYSNSQKVAMPDPPKGWDQGVAAITPDGKYMYLTRWTVKNGVKQACICVSTQSGGRWSDPVALGTNVNIDGYNSMQPFVTSDGKYLLFSSNRPGGMGKYDIWYSVISNNTPGSARNIGTAINTKDEEQAPFYDSEKGLLVFSSDGRIGLGGLDFFSSEGDFGSWSAPKNMGKPLNSPKDDIYYTALDNTHPFASGFISSDRESVCCLEIFGIKRLRKIVSGMIIDCDTHKPLEGATITLMDSARQKVMSKQTTDRAGRYTFEADPSRQYKLVAEKENYFTKGLPFRTDGLETVDSLENPTLCLKHYEIEKPIVINNIFYDFNKATLREESKVVLDTVVEMLKDNPRLTIEMAAHTDSIGSDKYNDKLSQARAQSCVNYLISKGIASNRLIAKGYGKRRPIAPNSLPNHKDNPEGRQLNRRTEFTVLRRQVEAPVNNNQTE
ncbi:OmpA family protein [Chitinophaga sp. Cy-1792]|uniref:OmpA family protein n=1 Tax=Chitinophaga sp. Cy-1792 TaxID=2608339 RepID=UPI0014226363|nr:OmpA family protein [Chitinophaga sp. Cy-1792]NIG52606.1 OmpA family protein [Chitinophaga sp. Cy-1792]